MFKNVSKVSSGKKPEKKRMTIAEARPILEEAETEKLLQDYDVIQEAINAVGKL